MNQQTETRLLVRMGENLKEARHSKGFTQQYLAAAAGISPRNYKRLEAGNHWPSLKTAAILAHHLGDKLSLFIPENLPI